MINPDFILLYVEKVSNSVTFYKKILGADPVEASPNFAMFVLGSGLSLGLWAKHDVQPMPKAAGGGCELGITVPSKEAVDNKFKEWNDQLFPIAQKPTEMDFGYTFVALDPDGHRLRVFCPAMPG